MKSPPEERRFLGVGVGACEVSFVPIKMLSFLFLKNSSRRIFDSFKIKKNNEGRKKGIMFY